MRNNIVCALCSLFFSVSAAHGSAFRIPNQSASAVGLTGAHIAYTPGPDASYYNPANMTRLQDTTHAEFGLTTLYLPSIEYVDNRSSLLNGTSNAETYLLPQLHLVSGSYGGLRFGFSLTYPFGLSKSWEQSFPAATSREFSLLVVEGNPTVAFPVTDWCSLGGGLRLVSGDGTVKNLATNPPFDQLGSLTGLGREMNGDTVEWGYNLALSLKPVDDVHLALTWRSGIDLGLEGDADLTAWTGSYLVAAYQGSGKVTVSLPAVLSVAASWRLEEVTVELVWERTMWSAYDALDFNYASSLVGTVFDGFDQVIEKNWDDGDAYRIGLSYDWSETLTTTLGFSYDRSPIPDDTLGFELPDADAFVYGAGVRYKWNPSLSLGFSYLYQHVRSRSLTNTDAGGETNIDGTFSKGGAHVVTAGMVFSF